jgi:hypothetical protein
VDVDGVDEEDCGINIAAPGSFVAPGITYAVPGDTYRFSRIKWCLWVRIAPPLTIMRTGCGARTITAINKSTAKMKVRVEPYDFIARYTLPTF